MTALATETPQSALNSRREAGLLLRSIRGHADSPLIPLEVGRHVIGSSPDADVRLDVQGVERQHAVLLVGPQRSVLKGFSRFTWVNDGVIRECAVKAGDRICFGPVEFEIVKPKSRRKRPSPSVPRAEAAEPVPAPAFSGWATTQATPLIAETPAPGPNASGPSRREQLIGELNAELLQHLAQLVKRETVAVDRERRLVEQSAQLEARRRLAEDRQRELERSQADFVRAEADWWKKVAEVAEQSAQLREDRETLERDRRKLMEDSARLDSQAQTLEERRAELDAREVRLEERNTALDLRASQLGHQEQRHSEVVAQALVHSNAYAEDVQRLAEQKLSLQREEEQIQHQVDQLSRDREQFELERNSLIAERAHLAMREVEIADLRRRVHEQQAELDARAQQAQALMAGAAASEKTSSGRATELAEREQRIAEAETALAAERHELDARKQELDQQHAAWMLDRHTESARVSQERRESNLEQQAEINLLRSQISELQSRLREERGLWEMERSELAARAEAAEAVQPIAVASEETDSSSADVAALQAQLEEERARYQKAQDAWEAEQDLLLRDRKALEAEWRRLEARAEQQYQEFEATAAAEGAFVVPPPVPSEFNDDFDPSDHHPHAETQADEQAWDQADPLPDAFADENLADARYEDDPHSTAAWSDADQDPQVYESNQQFEEPASFEDPETSGESQAPGSAPSVGGDVLSLRAQLAELFGLQATPMQEAQGSGETGYEGEIAFDSTAADEANGFEGASTSFETNEFGGTDFDSQAAAGGFDEETASDEADHQQSDEEIMSAYLARLLKKSPGDDEPARNPVRAAEPAVEAPAEQEDAAPEQEARPTRRLNAEEKETLRANLDSFRELANQHSRAAVAKHKSNELKSGMQMTSVVGVLIAVVGFVLLSAELWSSQSYRLYGFLCLAVSAGLGIYTLINGMRIRRLKGVERAAAELTEALSAEEDDEKPASE